MNPNVFEKGISRRRLEEDLRALYDEPTGLFDRLVTAAGLDPKVDFQKRDLRSIDFSGSNLHGFDFSGSDLRGTSLRYAKEIDSTTVLTHALLDPEDQSWLNAQKMSATIHPTSFFRIVDPPATSRGGAPPAPKTDLSVSESASRPASAEPRPVSPRGGPRVGVLPLQLVGTVEGESHLALGLAEEITSALARFRWMFLVSSSSIAQFAEQTRDENAIRQTFGLDFLLDGSIQHIGTRLRVTLRLVDLRNGNQVIWARRFDRQAHDLLTLQEVAAQIDPEILMSESRRAAHRPPQDATAYDLLLRALPLVTRFERAQFMQAGELLSQAVVKEPDYAAAHAWRSYWLVFLAGQGWAGEDDEVMADAARHAERAITLDPQDARGFAIAGHVRAFLHHRLREALALHERALALNPNLAMAWALSGFAHLYLGDWEEAERRLARYKQLSPMDPQAFVFDTITVLIALVERDYEGAVAAGRAVSEMSPALSAACKPYLAALGHLGQIQEAKVVRRRLLAIEPDFTVQRFLKTSPFERAADREHFAQGLRRAGLPEGEAAKPTSRDRAEESSLFERAADREHFAEGLRRVGLLEGEGAKLTSRDQAEILARQDIARTHGYERLVIHTPPSGTEPDTPDVVMLYPAGERWARWGLVRQPSGVLVWRCADSYQLGCFDTMAEALDAALDASGPTGHPCRRIAQDI